jgi:hypothetical protein
MVGRLTKAEEQNGICKFGLEGDLLNTTVFMMLAANPCPREDAPAYIRTQGVLDDHFVSLVKFYAGMQASKKDFLAAMSKDIHALDATLDVYTDPKVDRELAGRIERHCNSGQRTGLGSHRDRSCACAARHGLRLASLREETSILNNSPAIVSLLAASRRVAKS